MEIIFAAIFFIAGALLIIKGGDVFVDAAGWTSEVTGIPRVVIGATIVSFATTSPEYFVSLLAVIKGYNDLSIGNAVGSLSANIGIAFAILAICTPGAINDRLFGVKGLLMVLSGAALWLFCLNGALSVAEGAILLFIFVFSTYVNIGCSKDDGNAKKRKPGSREIFINALKFIGGGGAIILGSNLIVDNGKIIAGYLGVSEAIIGLTFVAIGTSLPEVVTSVAAIIKKQNALSIGNILGANILDATLILSTGAFISGGRLSVPQATVAVDLPAAFILMLIAVLPTALGGKIYRPQGVAAMGFYLSYLIYVTML